MNTKIKLDRINQKIENCDIKDLKSLSNRKRKIIYELIENIMINEQFPLTRKEQIKTLKNKIDRITIAIKQQAYIDWKQLRELERQKTEFETKLFTLEIWQDG